MKKILVALVTAAGVGAGMLAAPAGHATPPATAVPVTASETVTSDQATTAAAKEAKKPTKKQVARGKKLAKRVFKSKNPKKAFAKLSKMDQTLVIYVSKRVQGKPTAKVKKVKPKKSDKKKMAALMQGVRLDAKARKHPLQCWWIRGARETHLRWNIFFKILKFGEVYQEVRWCHNGIKVSATWREVGGYIYWPTITYQGHRKFSRWMNGQQKIYMASRHTFNVGIGKVHFDVPNCLRMGLGDYGSYWFSDSCKKVPA